MPDHTQTRTQCQTGQILPRSEQYLHNLVVLLLMIVLAGFARCRQNDKKIDEKSAAKPRNLLLLTLDTTRPDHLGCYGYRDATSPNLDRLAARGMRFTQAIATVPLTRPSHATMLTGLLPHHHGIWSNGPYRLDPAQPTLAEKLQGYRKGAVISSFVLNSSFGFNRGFDSFDERLQEILGEDPERPAEDALSAANNWIQHQDQHPFFLWVHFYDPHYPYAPPEPYLSRFSKQPYDGEIAYMDHAIGQLLDLLQQKGVLKDTLVVAVGDHGEGLGEHGEETHGYFLYDSTIRVPMILAGPGIPPGTVSDRTVSLIDLAPTLLEALGTKPGDTDGKSFWSTIPQQNFAPEIALIENRTIHYQFGWASIAGIRTDGWKWLSSPIPELYDLKSDPSETHNLAAERKAKTDEMSKLWQKLQPSEEANKTAELTPEEEEKLASLGYISSGPGSGPSEHMSGPDAKQFAGLTVLIEDVIRKRQKKEIEQTETDLQKILGADASNRFALRAKGELLLHQQKYPEALDVLKRLVDSSENHPETLAFLAMAYEKTGDSAHAAEYYRKATQPPWIYWPALESLARLSQSAPGTVKNADLATQMRSLSPQSYRETIPLARAFAILGQWDEAASMYQKALQQNSGGTEANVGYAQMLMKQGRTQDAISRLRGVSPPTVESLFVLGIALQSEGAPEACDVLRECARRNPTNANLRAGLSQALQRCK